MISFSFPCALDEKLSTSQSLIYWENTLHISSSRYLVDLDLFVREFFVREFFDHDFLVCDFCRPRFFRLRFFVRDFLDCDLLVRDFVVWIFVAVAMVGA